MTNARIAQAAVRVRLQPDPARLPGEDGRDRAGPPLGAGDRRAGEEAAEQQEERGDEHGAVLTAASTSR